MHFRLICIAASIAASVHHPPAPRMDLQEPPSRAPSRNRQTNNDNSDVRTHLATADTANTVFAASYGSHMVLFSRRPTEGEAVIFMGIHHSTGTAEGDKRHLEISLFGDSASPPSMASSQSHQSRTATVHPYNAMEDRGLACGVPRCSVVSHSRYSRYTCTHRVKSTLWGCAAGTCRTPTSFRISSMLQQL